MVTRSSTPFCNGVAVIIILFSEERQISNAHFDDIVSGFLKWCASSIINKPILGLSVIFWVWSAPCESKFTPFLIDIFPFRIVLKCTLFPHHFFTSACHLPNKAGGIIINTGVVFFSIRSCARSFIHWISLISFLQYHYFQLHNSVLRKGY